ncbi:MAG: cupin domain-containing protein [Thermoleophilia bacterium]|nr:cupin domain-containing protein [Thermoleophilia bacterium]
MGETEVKGFGAPDEERSLRGARAEILHIGGGTVGRYTVQPGWRWTTHMKAAAGTELCEAPHFQYHVSGRLGVRMADGTELEIGPGEVSVLPPGHDAWVVGGEPVVVVDWSGASVWASS